MNTQHECLRIANERIRVLEATIRDYEQIKVALDASKNTGGVPLEDIAPELSVEAKP